MTSGVGEQDSSAAAKATVDAETSAGNDHVQAHALVLLRRESLGPPEANATRSADGFFNVVRQCAARTSMVRTSVDQYFDIGDEGNEQGDQDFDAFRHEELVLLKATGIHTMTRPTVVNTARGWASPAPSGNGGWGWWRLVG